MTLEEFMQAFCHETEHRECGRTRHHGLTPEGLDACARHIPPGYTEVAKWRDGRYRAVWKSDDEHTIITYCEGDVYVSRYERREGYAIALADAAAFYRQH